jgi:hypothetical protein
VQVIDSSAVGRGWSEDESIAAGADASVDYQEIGVSIIPLKCFREQIVPAAAGHCY